MGCVEGSNPFANDLNMGYPTLGKRGTLSGGQVGAALNKASLESDFSKTPLILSVR